MSDKPKPFDPLLLVTEEPPASPGARRFVVDSDRAYPAVVAAIAAGAKCSTSAAAYYDRLAAKARADSQALEDAVAECGEREVEFDQEVVVGGTQLPDGAIVGGRRETRRVTGTMPVPPCEHLPADRLPGRAFVLEVARKWFTNELQQSAGGGPIEVKWPKSDRWRLGLPAGVLEEMERRV